MNIIATAYIGLYGKYDNHYIKFMDAFSYIVTQIIDVKKAVISKNSCKFTETGKKA